jgi:PAS domain S-box-containing protein
MPEHHTTDAVISLDAAGHYVGATIAALELLGVSAAELRGSAPDRFAMGGPIDGDRAVARAHLESGSTQPLVGTTGLRRADGTTIRVAYAIEPAAAGFRARLWLIDGSPEAPTTVYTADEVLRQWRAAERELARLAPGTPEWARTMNEIAVFREQYQELFRAIERPPGTT